MLFLVAKLKSLQETIWCITTYQKYIYNQWRQPPCCVCVCLCSGQRGRFGYHSSFSSYWYGYKSISKTCRQEAAPNSSNCAGATISSCLPATYHFGFMDPEYMFKIACILYIHTMGMAQNLRCQLTHTTRHVWYLRILF